MRKAESWAWTTKRECELNKTGGLCNDRQSWDMFRASTAFKPITLAFAKILSWFPHLFSSSIPILFKKKNPVYCQLCFYTWLPKIAINLLGNNIENQVQSWYCPDQSQNLKICVTIICLYSTSSPFPVKIHVLLSLGPRKDKSTHNHKKIKYGWKIKMFCTMNRYWCLYWLTHFKVMFYL